MPQQQHPRLRPAPIPVFPSGRSSATNPVNPMHEEVKGGEALREFRQPLANVHGGSGTQTRHVTPALAPDHDCKTSS